MEHSCALSNLIIAKITIIRARDARERFAQEALRVESGCVTLQSLVLSISIMCKDLWKLLHDINTSMLTEWNYERISYKPYVTTREIPRITHHV
jgi:hypothetical protein